MIDIKSAFGPQPRPIASSDQSEQLGGHTVDNAKRTLNEYFQLHQMKNIEYNVKEVTPQQRFRAELKVHIKDLRREVYVQGESSTKKMAEICAFQIVRELFEGGKIAPYAEGKKARPSFNDVGWGNFLPDSARLRRTSLKPAEAMIDIKSAFGPQPRPIVTSASSEQLGGHTVDNAKRTLNEYFQLHQMKNIEYNVKEVTPQQRFRAELKVHIRDLRRANKFMCKANLRQRRWPQICAFQIVRELFEGGKIAPYTEGKKARPSFDDLTEITIKVPEESVRRAYYIASQCGITPVDPSSAMPYSPMSLIPVVPIETYSNVQRLPRQQSVPCSAPSDGFHSWKSRPLRAEEDFYGKNLTEVSEMLRARDAAKTLPQHIRNLRERLPVYQFREEIIQAVDRNCLVLIKGSTGNGKSTQIVQYLLEEHIKSGLGAAFNAIVSQPRRISALTLAERVAFERGESIGDSVGYAIRFDAAFPRPFGSITFVTVGVLLRMMETGLNGISHIIVDEIHERDIKTDFLLILLREVVRTYPHMRLILMSATFDVDLLKGYFGDFPVIEMNVRTHSVEHFFLEDVVQKLKYFPSPSRKRGDDDDYVDPMGDNFSERPLIAAHMEGMYTNLTKQALMKMREKEIPFELIEKLIVDIHQREQQGAVLVFLPGWAHIFTLLKSMQVHPVLGDTNKFVVLPLHSQLTSAEQHKVFEHVPAGMRKIILSTNISESSVTIDDIVFVIDTCKVKEKVYSVQNNIVHFATVWAARSNLIQRRGRAGRVRAGYCYHLCTRSRFDSLEEHRTAEILRTPLHELALTVKLLRLGSIREVLGSALEPPPRQAIIEAEKILREINALDNAYELTPLGRILAKLPIDPLVGKALVLASAFGIGDLMCSVAAASGFSSPFSMREMHSYPQMAFAGSRCSDHITVLTAFNKYVETSDFGEASIYKFCRDSGLSPTIMKMITEAKKQIKDTLISIIGFPHDCYAVPALSRHQAEDANLDLVTSLLVSAYYPNICVHRQKKIVYTVEKMLAHISSSSVNARKNKFKYPFFVFTEKLKTRIVQCLQMTMVSPVQLLLFGCRKVEAKSDSVVVLDDVFTLHVNAAHAAAIVALRPCIEAYLMRISLNPQFLVQQTAADNDLRLIVRELSSSNACQVLARGTPVVPSYQQIAQQFYDQGYGFGNPLIADPSHNNAVAASAQAWASYSNGMGCGAGPPVVNAYGNSAPTYEAFAEQVESRKRQYSTQNQEVDLNSIFLPPEPRRPKSE
ncbi:hypothetical protein L596_014773 [Steinernema carpocapsae]|uniref:RNA helicase n=1 Tax=Steinernema carpocapsae TaxID=34508 RepID=A0A4U5NCV7_STECR|nr:hypothetical protein L596_014773 [Steinernema carpocapsae]